MTAVEGGKEFPNRWDQLFIDQEELAAANPHAAAVLEALLKASRLFRQAHHWERQENSSERHMSIRLLEYHQRALEDAFNWGPPPVADLTTAAAPTTPTPAVLTEPERAPRFPTRTALQAIARKHRLGSATWVSRSPKAELFRALQSRGVIA